MTLNPLRNPDYAKRTVALPAMFLMVIGGVTGFTFLGGVLVSLVETYATPPEARMVPFLTDGGNRTLMALGALVGLYVVLGGWMMKSLRNYGCAASACLVVLLASAPFCCFVPLLPVGFLGGIAGLAGLAALADPEVRRAFR